MKEDAIKKEALRVLLNNRKVGYSEWAEKYYDFSCPSPRTYPYQWFWDSCFHAIALAHLDPERAKNELRSLLSMQREDGFIPHVIFWENRLLRRYQKPWNYLQSKGWSLWPRLTGMIQPPVLAFAIERVYQKTGDDAFLAELLPGARRYYEWLAKNRDPDRDYLISIISPYESGLDYSPCYDAAVGFRGTNLKLLYIKDRLLDLKNKIAGFDSLRILERDWFNVEDVMVNSVYAEALKTMARLFETTNDIGNARVFSERGKAVALALIQKCFDKQEGIFHSLSSKKETRLSVKTVTSLMPIMLDEIDRATLKRLIEEHLLNEKEFWLPCPVPTVAKSEPSFNPNDNRYIWRGPSWINTNWFLIRGLRKHEYHDIADRITATSKEMIEKSGFREFFNPLTGEGYGAQSFGWSTLIVDMMKG